MLANSTPHGLELALAHHRAGRRAEAEAEYRRVLEADPNHPTALYGLGTLALQAGQYDLAEDLIRRAIAARGDWAEGSYHLGIALQSRGKFEQAIVAHRRAVALNPALFDAHFNLAVCLQLIGQGSRAIPAYQRAIEIRSNDPVALVNYAIALRGAGRQNDAIAALRKATDLNPDFGEAFAELADVLREQDLLEESIAAYQRARQLGTRGQKTSAGFASALWESGRIDEAIEIERELLATHPEDAEAHSALASLLLLRGDFSEGLAHFEWRWRRKNVPWPRRRFSQPRWDGADLHGRTIYLHAEQSIGDTIQFIRFLPMVARRGGKMIVECQPSLRRLFEGNWDVEHWFSPGDPLPPFDVYCPLGSLPLVLASGSVTADVPYLRAGDWPEPIGGNRLKIGLVWAGSPSELQDRKRSMNLSQLSPLAEIPAQFFSLQKGRPAKQAREGAAIELTDLSDQLADFADTAALIAEMDLIITVDTAVAHLAGAMGKPVWTLLPFVPHWRWMMTGDRTPWYPTMRLFRQPRPGDWDEPVLRVATELNELLSRGPKS